MVTVAEERAALSRQRLSKQHGPIMRRWSGARRAVWRIDRSWDVERLLRHVQLRRQDVEWEPLKFVPREIQEVDGHVRSLAGCYPRLRYDVALPPEVSMDDIRAKARELGMNVDPLKLRALLSRSARKGHLRRKRRGVYVYSDDDDLRRSDLEYMLDVEARWQAWGERRFQSETAVLLAHYLLPHLHAYRKARQLGLSERTYYERLASALQSVGWMVRV
jgi:hypothetical protein